MKVWCDGSQVALLISLTLWVITWLLPRLWAVTSNTTGSAWREPVASPGWRLSLLIYTPCHTEHNWETFYKSLWIEQSNKSESILWYWTRAAVHRDNRADRLYPEWVIVCIQQASVVCYSTHNNSNYRYMTGIIGLFIFLSAKKKKIWVIH